MQRDPSSDRKSKSKSRPRGESQGHGTAREGSRDRSANREKSHGHSSRSKGQSQDRRSKDKVGKDSRVDEWVTASVEAAAASEEMYETPIPSNKTSSTQRPRIPTPPRHSDRRSKSRSKGADKKKDPSIKNPQENGTPAKQSKSQINPTKKVTSKPQIMTPNSGKIAPIHHAPKKPIYEQDSLATSDTILRFPSSRSAQDANIQRRRRLRKAPKKEESISSSLAAIVEETTMIEPPDLILFDTNQPFPVDKEFRKYYMYCSFAGRIFLLLSAYFGLNALWIFYINSNKEDIIDPKIAKKNPGLWVIELLSIAGYLTLYFTTLKFGKDWPTGLHLVPLIGMEMSTLVFLGTTVLIFCEGLANVILFFLLLICGNFFIIFLYCFTTSIEILGKNLYIITCIVIPIFAVGFIWIEALILDEDQRTDGLEEFEEMGTIYLLISISLIMAIIFSSMIVFEVKGYLNGERMVLLPKHWIFVSLLLPLSFFVNVKRSIKKLRKEMTAKRRFDKFRKKKSVKT